MRIIAGEFRGRRLAAVRGRLRPTSDKVREAIFNILGPKVKDAEVLDLYAGTGALAWEALSRGARHAVLVEEQGAVLEVLRRNQETLGLKEQARVLPLSVPVALKKLAGQGARFDLIFLDPPYGQGLAAATLATLADLDLVRPGGQVVAEAGRREALPEKVGNLILSHTRIYGDTQVAFYERPNHLIEQEQRT
jgi:16S rRNA (guanine(966)-N(2))-methyltransferase RsmD